MGYSLSEIVKTRPRTRIVCTIGPATGSVDAIARLVEAGMSVARLNLSHGDTSAHAAYIGAIREVAGDRGLPIAILADLPGPKYRLGEVSRPGIVLGDGEPFVLKGDDSPATDTSASVWPRGLFADVTSGASILVDEGAIGLQVQSVEGDEIHCVVTDGGELHARKAVTAPGNTSTLDYFTDETVNALELAARHGVDFVGLSYIRNLDDLRRVREFFKKRRANPQLIAKIECKEAVQNLDSILEAADGVMVARGDLGVELPLEEVPGVQKRMIRAANDAGKVVITATQMLESMIEAPHPTRAEATDVHNAVREGTDAIMLSGETSIGRYPIRATRYMARIALKAEEEMDNELFMERRNAANIRHGVAVDDTIAYSACRTALDLKAKVILAFTESGSTAERIASFRPKTPILAMIRDPSAGARLALRWGVMTLEVPRFEQVQAMFIEGSRAAIDIGLASDGDTAIAVVGMPIGVPGNTNLMRVIRVPEPDPSNG